tara:strand:+ start:322 stop:543 length:222 start_codon:yes stop_codon:yes gene_type:complete
VLRCPVFIGVSMSVQITREDFLEYKKVQKSGKYNMFMDARDVMDEIDLTKEQYFKILKEYRKLDKEWGKEDES